MRKGYYHSHFNTMLQRVDVCFCVTLLFVCHPRFQWLDSARPRTCVAVVYGDAQCECCSPLLSLLSLCWLAQNSSVSLHCAFLVWWCTALVFRCEKAFPGMPYPLRVACENACKGTIFPRKCRMWLLVECEAQGSELFHRVRFFSWAPSTPPLHRSEIDFPKSSEAFVCFECTAPRVSWTYLMTGMETGMRALPHANETYFRVNGEGILCIQHQASTVAPLF